MNARGNNRRKVIDEPCTLVYTLNDDTALNFEEFSLIVRSLHSYMVEDIITRPCANQIHVKLLYQASVNNAEKKLGYKLLNIISITKLSAFVKEDELSALDALRKRFGFKSGPSADSDGNNEPPRKKAKKFKNVPRVVEEDGESECE